MPLFCVSMSSFKCGRSSDSKKRADFLSFMDSLVSDHDDSQEIHVILDNHSIHKGVDEWLRLHPNVSFHYTQTSAGWLTKSRNL
jgi:hypothetical protein